MITRAKVTFEKLYGETDRAFLLLVGNTEMWFPKRYCWDFVVNKKLGGHMVIPSWLYREKFGCEPDVEDAETIIEHHKPEKVEPQNTAPHADLVR